MFLSKGFHRFYVLTTSRILRYSTNAKTNDTKNDCPAKRETIQIPKRIDRSPTAILEALASTVSRDYTAPHYKYIDDPFFIPSSHTAKRSYALSRESGRKAARWIFNQNPKLFEIVESDPKIEAFLPLSTYDEKSDVSEDTLKQCIEKRRVETSNTVYQLLKQKNITIGSELQQSLLELFCFHNSQEPKNEDDFEERWFELPQKEKRKIWQDDGLADQLFNSIEVKTAAAYCVMIRGLAKYLDVDRAYNLYKEMQEKQLFTDVTTYNSLISICSYLRDSSELKWHLCHELLTNMQREGVIPNLQTFNSVLEVLGRIRKWRNAMKLSLETVGEMKQLGIEPSLATYAFLLNVHCKENGPVSTILYDIMNQLDGKELQIRDSRDIMFFVTAMAVCHNHLMDKDLALRINDLLNIGNNYHLLGESVRESIYFQRLFSVLCFADSLDNFMAFYRKYVPNIYTPEKSIYQDIIQTISLNSAWEYIPQIWTDIVAYDHFHKETILQSILKVVGENAVEGQLQQQFFEIAWYIKERLDAQVDERIRNIINWTGEMLSNIMQACMNAKQFDKAWEILQQCKNDELKIVGHLNEKVLNTFLNSCVEDNDLKKAMACLRYISDAGLSNTKYADVVFKLPLTDNEKSKVRHLMSSQDFLKLSVDKEE